MKRAIAILAITAIHLLITRIVIALTEMRVAAVAFGDPASFSSSLLVAATKVLSFPIITLSFYSRQWYPGNLVYIPFVLNSLVWAAVVYLLVSIVNRSRSSDR